MFIFQSIWFSESFVKSLTQLINLKLFFTSWSMGCYWILINLFWFHVVSTKVNTCVCTYLIDGMVWRFFSFFTTQQTFKYCFSLYSVCTGHLWHFSTVSNVVLLKWQYMLDSSVEWNDFGTRLFFFLLIGWLCWSM